MESKIGAFYRGDRVSQVALFSFGALCVAIGVGYYLWKGDGLSLGILFSVSIIGLYQMLISVFKIWRSFRLYDKSMASFQSDKSYLKNTEKPRIAALNQRIVTMRKIESLLILVGFVMLILSVLQKENVFIFAAAIGISLHASFLLCFDLISQFRIIEYERQLEKILRR